MYAKERVSNFFDVCAGIKHVDIIAVLSLKFKTL